MPTRLETGLSTISLGIPHYSGDELRRLPDELDSRAVHRSIDSTFNTGRHVLASELEIEAAPAGLGVQVITASQGPATSCDPGAAAQRIRVQIAVLGFPIPLGHEGTVSAGV